MNVTLSLSHIAPSSNILSPHNVSDDEEEEGVRKRNLESKTSDTSWIRDLYRRNRVEKERLFFLEKNPSACKISFPLSSSPLLSERRGPAPLLTAYQKGGGSITKGKKV